MKIGLIAVSGVRIANSRLLELGLTLPGFVERARVIAAMPSLGLLSVAAALPEHHDLHYIELEDYDEAQLGRTDFELVAISSFTAKAEVMYAVAKHYRRRGVPVVLGGLHVTLVPDEATQHADAIVVGEGERLFPQVVRDASAGRLRRRYANSSPRDVSLAECPAPRFDLLVPGRYNRMPVQTARGCPLACEFCAASRIFGAYKRKPVDRVVRDVRAAKSYAGHPFMELADDNSFVHKAWAKELVRALAREDIRWFTETDVSVADDPVLLDLLADSGCRQLLIGFESPTADALAGVDPAGFKRRHYDRYRRAIDQVQSRGVSVNGCFVLGLDGHDPGVFEDVERFVADAGLTEVQVTVLTPFPGTALYRRLLAEGRLLEERFWDRCTLFDVCFEPLGMGVRDLEQGLEYLVRTLYAEPATRARRRHHARLAARARQDVASSDPASQGIQGDSPAPTTPPRD